MTWLLLPLAFADPTVDVPGIGTVPLDAAIATCVDEQPVGAVADGKGDRQAAFSQVMRPLLAQTPEMRKARFGEDWPTRSVDLDYIGSTQVWQPQGVATSCWAVGKHFVERGLELRATCETKAGCKAFFADDEQDVVREALKGKLKGRNDQMFAALAGLKGLTSWRDPRVFLDKACALPVQSAGRQWMIDTDDLAAARSACVQMLTLIEGDVSPQLAKIPCAHPDWTRAPADVVASPVSDLGVTDAHREVQVATLLDKLTRMDPALSACDNTDHGSVWHGDLWKRWREAQRTSACADPELGHADRLAFCPDLVSRAQSGCKARDHQSCELLAQLYEEGVGVDQDERKAIETWQVSCNAAHAPACEAIAARRAVVEAWLAEAMGLARAVTPGQTFEVDPFTTVHGLLAQFGAALGQDWVKASAPGLFEAALKAEQIKHARDVIALYGASLGDAWTDTARTQLGGLEAEIAKRKP